MTRIKINPADKLMHKVTLRLTDAYVQKQRDILSRSNCRSLTELIRNILLQRQIIVDHRNASLDECILEFSRIRKEVNAIGNNINQIIKHFHTSDTTGQRLFQATKVAGQYDKLMIQLTAVTKLINTVVDKWSPKSA